MTLLLIRLPVRGCLANATTWRSCRLALRWCRHETAVSAPQHSSRSAANSCFASRAICHRRPAHTFFEPSGTGQRTAWRPLYPAKCTPRDLSTAHHETTRGAFGCPATLGWDTCSRAEAGDGRRRAALRDVRGRERGRARACAGVPPESVIGAWTAARPATIADLRCASPGLTPCTQTTHV